MLSRGDEHIAGLDLGAYVAFLKLPLQAQWFTGAGYSDNTHGLLLDGRRRICVRPAGFIQLWIVVAPNPVANAHAREIDGVVGESQAKLAGPECRDFIQAAAFFALLRTAPIC